MYPRVRNKDYDEDEYWCHSGMSTEISYGDDLEKTITKQHSQQPKSVFNSPKLNKNVKLKMNNR